jgi:hypothetical protein
MNYTLRITKTEENPNFQAQMEEWNQKTFSRGNGWRSEESQPQAQIVTNLLHVTLTAEQFDAVKKAVIEQFK